MLKYLMYNNSMYKCPKYDSHKLLFYNEKVVNIVLFIENGKHFRVMYKPTIIENLLRPSQ